MAWPNERIVPEENRVKRLPQEEKRRYWNSRHRAVIGNICNKCNVEPRSSTMTICKKCNNKRRAENEKRWIQNRKRKDALKAAAEFGGRCLTCRCRIEVPITKRLKIKYLCTSCARDLFIEVGRSWREVGKRTREMVFRFREARGVLPANAWESLPKLNRGRR